MCAFCAAIPVAGVTGARLHAKEKEKRQKAEANGTPLPKEKHIPQITAGVMGTLVICSVVYHTVLMTRLQIPI